MKTLPLELSNVCGKLRAVRRKERLACFYGVANGGRMASDTRALVESFRTARESRQRVLAYLDELKPSEESGWAKLGAHLDEKEQKRRPQLSLFDPPHAPPCALTAAVHAGGRSPRASERRAAQSDCATSATSCCRHRPRMAPRKPSASATSPNPKPPKPSSSTASASNSPAASAASTP